MSITDEVAFHTLKEANDALEKKIDETLINGRYARRIILFDGLDHHIVSTGGTVNSQANDIVNTILGGIDLFGISSTGASTTLPKNYL